MLSLTAAVTALAGWSALVSTRVASGIGDVDPSMNTTQSTLDDYEAVFGRDVYWLVVARGNNVFDYQFLTRLRALQNDLEQLSVAGDEGPVFDEVYSLLDAWTTRFEDGAPVVERYFRPFPAPIELDALRRRVLGDPLVAGQIVDERGEHTVILLQTELDLGRHGELLAALNETIERAEVPDFALSLAGEPVLLAEFNHLLITDTPLLVLITVVLLIVLGGVVFRHPLAVMGPLLIVVCSAIGTFGVMAAVGLPVTMVTTIIPVLLFCVGLGGSVHMISAFRDLRGDGQSSDDAVIGALATTGVPIVYTALTTMVGLLSFRFAGIGIIRDMGASAAIGVAITLIHTLILLPALLTFTRRGLLVRRGDGRADLIERGLRVCMSLAGLNGSSRRRAVVLVSSGLLLASAVLGMTRLRLGYDPLRRIPTTSQLHDGFEIMDEYLGGTSTVSLLIEVDDTDVLQDLEVITALSRLEEEIRSYRDPDEGDIIGPSTGYLVLLRGAHRAITGGAASEFRLPADDAELEEVWQALAEAPRALLSPIISRDGRTTQISFRVKHIDALGYEPLTAHVQRAIAAQTWRGARVRPTGTVYSDMAVSNLVTRDLVRSFAIAFIVISVLMIFVLRNIKLGLLAMLPNLMPIALVMGVMGFAGIRSDIDTILIASIALGIVVDDTIHLLHQFRLGVARGESPDDALCRALNHAGRAIVATSVIIVLGFLVLLASSLANVRVFGLLISLIAALALICDLVMTPALISLAANVRSRTLS